MSDSFNIHFFTEKISFQPLYPSILKTWIEKCIRLSKRNLSNLTYIFCSDRYLYKLNKKYLQHNTLTDVITFDYAQGTTLIVADVYISIERVQENANNFKVPFCEELSRVLIHAVLHMVGYNDKTPKEKQQVRNKENEYLSMPLLQKYFSKVALETLDNALH